MTFHADFWVVAGTAAPVIALSTILVSADQLRLAIDFEEASRMPEGISIWKWTEDRWAIFGWSIVTLIIIVLQAIILVFSLLSLVQQSNYFSPTPVAMVEAASLGSLALVSTRFVQQRYWVGQIERERHSRKSEILRHPSRKPQLNSFRRATRYTSKRSISNARRNRMRS